MELTQVKTNPNGSNSGNTLKVNSVSYSPFIEANTKEVSLSYLGGNCIIPVFSKDNEKTLAHQEFIDTTLNAVKSVFGDVQYTPEIRVSHCVKGRIPEAIHKPAKQLLDHEKTQYYERMAFIVRIPNISCEVGGNKLILTCGGVRAYNQENLYRRKSVERFKVFIGFQNLVCCNLCISTDGSLAEFRTSSSDELFANIIDLFNTFRNNNDISVYKDMLDYSLTEHQFAQLLGKTRLYNHLPLEDKRLLPSLMLNDGQLSVVAKDYYKDQSFCRREDGSINLWKVYNLFTSANKSSYIDTFLDRNVNAFSFVRGLQKTLMGSSAYHWYLS